MIADVELPGMNGLNLIKQLGDDLLGIPTIVITGKGTDERNVEAIEAGAYWYIDKPFKKPILQALLARALESVLNARERESLSRQPREAGPLRQLVDPP